MKAKDLLLLQNYPSVLIYGPAGTGKTALVSQANNSYMFDFDDGMRTAALLEDKFTSLRQDCEFDTYKDSEPSKPTRWSAFTKKLFEFSKMSAKGKITHDGKDIDTIIVDSLSGMAKSMQLHIMYVATTDAFRKPQIQHWGDMVSEIEKCLTILRSLKCLLIVTAHEMDFEVDGINLIRPLSITEKHGKNKLAWLFDEVLHTSLRPAGMNKHKYMLSGHSTTSILARTRSKMTEEIDVSEIGLAGVLEKIGYKK